MMSKETSARWTSQLGPRTTLTNEKSKNINTFKLPDMTTQLQKRSAKIFIVVLPYAKFKMEVARIFIVILSLRQYE
jgi:hypothetical protein